MTRAAGNHFRHLAAVTGVDMPRVLSGNPVELGSNITLPNYSVEPLVVADRLHSLVGNANSQLVKAGAFLLRSAQVMYEDEPAVSSSDAIETEATAASQSVADKLFQELHMAGPIAGSLQNFRLAAIHETELPKLVTRYLKNQRRRRLPKSGELLSAHLLLTADVKAGSGPELFGLTGKYVHLAVRARRDSQNPKHLHEVEPRLYTAVRALTDPDKLEIARARNMRRGGFGAERRRIERLNSETETA